MFSFAIFKQDFRINQKTLAICGCGQALSLLLAAVIRNMRLIDISDIFWDTIPVVILPMAMQAVLAHSVLKRCEDERTMTFLFSTAIAPEAILATKAVFLVVANVALFVPSMLLGCLLHVYDLTGVWEQEAYVGLNLGGMCLQFFAGGWCYLVACLPKSESPVFFWLASAGVLALFYAIYVAYYWAGNLFFLQFLTFFSLFRQEWFATGDILSVVGCACFLVAGFVCFGFGRYTFCRRGLRA